MGKKHSKELMTNLMEMMQIVRKFEERVQSLFSKGLVHGTTHLGIGEEATGTGSMMAIKENDYLLATHRGHGQALAKGVDVKDAMAEILARQAGTNNGLGGSMHIADFDKNVLGANGILGAAAPIACGVAQSIRMKKVADTIVAVFIGDGATNEGAFHEAMNLAAVWKLPVMFICTNNSYGMSTPLASVANDTDLTKRAIPYNMKSYEVDGNDVLAVYDTVTEARKYMIANEEPVFIVEHTYRTSGHSKSDGNLYRTKEEIELWRQNNPVIRFSKVMLENGFTQQEVDDIDKKTTDIIEEATTYALSCEEPAMYDIEKAVYAD